MASSHCEFSYAYGYSLNLTIFPTMDAFIWLLPSMSFYMDFKITFRWKKIITSIALVWLLPRMSTHMNFKITILWKYFITVGALIWLLPRVNTHMHFQYYLSVNILYQLLYWYRVSPTSTWTTISEIIESWPNSILMDNAFWYCS